MSGLNINSFFLMDLDEFLQSVFLNLDPASLKNSRCVSKQWNCFIQDRVWNSLNCKKVLREKLRQLWKTGIPRVSEFGVGGSAGISWIACDETFVYFSTWSERVTVHEIETGNPRHQLEYQAYQHSPTQEYYCEMITVGKDYFAVLTSHDEIILVNKDSGELSEKIGNGEVTYITMFDNKILAEVGGEGRISVLETTENGSLIIRSVVNKDSYPMNDTSTDGDWIATGSGEGCKIWKLSELGKGPVYRIRTENYAYRIVLHFPYIFLLVMVPPYFSLKTGLEVWNVLTDTLLRFVKLDHEGFYFISSNGDFLALCPDNEDDEESQSLQSTESLHCDVSIVLFEIKELVGSEISDDKLWRRILTCSANPNEFLCAALTKTSLVIAAGSKVEVHKFWAE